MDKYGLKINTESVPGQIHTMHYYDCPNLTESISTIIEVLHRHDLEVETTNVGDFFTLIVTLPSKNKISFAFEYGMRTKGEFNDPIVLIALKEPK